MVDWRQGSRTQGQGKAGRAQGDKQLLNSLRYPGNIFVQERGSVVSSLSLSGLIFLVFLLVVRILPTWRDLGYLALDYVDV